MLTIRPVCAASILAASVVALAAEQQPTFRSGVRTVPVYATAVDGSGRLVADLEQTDFEILDNGKPVTLTSFSNEPQPFTAVVMLDTSASMTEHLKLLNQAAEQFLLRLLPVDRAQVGAFNDKLQLSGEFSNDRDALIAALDELQFGNATRLWDALAFSLDALKGVDGRRVVLLFTDGDDNASRRGLGDVMKRAQAEDYMVYGIGLRSVINRQETRPDGGLKRIATETGGGYFELSKTDELNATFSRVADELHRQYVLGFTPATLDGKDHKLNVVVTRAGMTARARKSYVASRKQ